MKIYDKTPLQDEKGEIGLFQRLQGTLKYGFSWYPELEAQKTIIAQLDRALEKGFVLIRNLTLPGSQIVEPIILIGPPGVYVIYVTPLSGFYEAKGDQWNVVKDARSSPAQINLLSRAARLARVLQVYLDRQNLKLPGPIEPVLIASSPAMHIESTRPAIRVVMIDAIRQFALSLLQADPALRTDFVHDLADRIITPRPPASAPVLAQQPASEMSSPSDVKPESEESPSRAQAIFQAAGEAKPFDPTDLSFAYDEGVGDEVPPDLREPSPSQPLPRTTPRRGMSMVQWIFLAGMALVECCVLAGFGYLLFFSIR